MVSPVLKGAEGLAQVAAALTTLTEKGHGVNDTCGVHVHVGWPINATPAQLARLVTIVAYLEQALYAATGTKKRERGIYCEGVRKYNRYGAAKQAMDHQRRHVLNISNLANQYINNKHTVEFRVFSGSTSPLKVLAWIQICLGLVERALNGKRNPVWEPKPARGGWAKKGIGASETERLLGYLAWGAGYARIHGGETYGWILPEGRIAGITQDAAKTELRRLAKKYDELP